MPPTREIPILGDDQPLVLIEKFVYTWRWSTFGIDMLQLTL